MSVLYCKRINKYTSDSINRNTRLHTTQITLASLKKFDVSKNIVYFRSQNKKEINVCILVLFKCLFIKLKV